MGSARELNYALQRTNCIQWRAVRIRLTAPAHWFRQALRARGTNPCIPGRSGRSRPIRHSKQLYRSRHKIEIMFGRLKDWRRIATGYDRCAHAFMSAIALAATVLFWLPQ